MTRNQETDALLRTLDAADRQVSADTRRARDDLQLILSTDPAAAPRQHPRPAGGAGRTSQQPGSRARTARRLAVAAAAVAAVTAGLIVLPSFNGGDPAFASWTPAPTGLTAAERGRAAENCRSSQQDTAGGLYSQDAAAAQVAIAERRGVWTTVVLTGADGFSALCITDESSNPFAKSMIGMIGKPADHAGPRPRDLTAVTLGTGTMGAGDISMAAGIAGAEVAGVSYRSQRHGTVTATVSLGQFALWLPGDELQNAASEGVEVDVTYRDGSTAVRRLDL